MPEDILDLKYKAARQALTELDGELARQDSSGASLAAPCAWA